MYWLSQNFEKKFYISVKTYHRKSYSLFSVKMKLGFYNAKIEWQLVKPIKKIKDLISCFAAGKSNGVFRNLSNMYDGTFLWNANVANWFHSQWWKKGTKWPFFISWPASCAIILFSIWKCSDCLWITARLTNSLVIM